MLTGVIEWPMKKEENGSEQSRAPVEGILSVANIIKLDEGVTTRLVQATVPAERDAADAAATLKDVSEVALAPTVGDVANEEGARRAARAARRRASSGRRRHAARARGGREAGAARFGNNDNGDYTQTDHPHVDGQIRGLASTVPSPRVTI